MPILSFKHYHPNIYPMEFLERWPQRQGKLKPFEPAQTLENLRFKILQLLTKIKSIGLVTTMDDYEKRKLGIFNKLNFLQLLTGIIIPVTGFFRVETLPFGVWAMACLPALASIIILYLNYQRKYEVALLSYFILYTYIPFVILLLT